LCSVIDCCGVLWSVLECYGVLESCGVLWSVVLWSVVKCGGVLFFFWSVVKWSVVKSNVVECCGVCFGVEVFGYLGYSPNLKLTRIRSWCAKTYRIDDNKSHTCHKHERTCLLQL